MSEVDDAQRLDERVRRLRAQEGLGASKVAGPPGSGRLPIDWAAIPPGPSAANGWQVEPTTAIRVVGASLVEIKREANGDVTISIVDGYDDHKITIASPGAVTYTPPSEDE